jgi:hypothetical protein
MSFHMVTNISEEWWLHFLRGIWGHLSYADVHFFCVWWDLRHQVLRPLLAYCTAPNDRWGWVWSNWWNEDSQGKPKYSEKTYCSATLSTTNPTWPDPCANPGRRGGKPATNRLSYGAASGVHLLDCTVPSRRKLRYKCVLPWKPEILYTLMAGGITRAVNRLGNVGTG